MPAHRPYIRFRRRLQCGACHSLVDLQARSEEHDGRPKPLVWTADPDRIIEKAHEGAMRAASEDVGAWGKPRLKVRLMSPSAP